MEGPLAIFRPFEDLSGLRGRLETSEMPIWRSYDFLSVISGFVSKNYPRHSEIQLSMIFGGGVKSSISVFVLAFGPKLTCACFGSLI